MSTTQSDQWFAVDRDGLATLLDRQGRGRVIAELVQNALDEEGVTEVSVDIHPIPARAMATVMVQDDAPNGFADLSHAFTLFAPSAKLADAEKRGRFNLGEKLVLALCKEATIVSTTGGWGFDGKGRRRLRDRTVKGSTFTGWMNLTRDQVTEALDTLHSLIPPDGIRITINDIVLHPWTPLRTFTAALPTEVQSDDGLVRKLSRTASVSLYRPLDGEQPMIYEMGIPVDAHDGAWHIDVGQKIPLSMDRTSVPASYVTKLNAAVLDAAADLLDDTTAKAGWVADALPKLRTDEAVRTVVEKQWGKGAVSASVADRESVNQAINKGRTVIPGRAMSKEAWARVRAAEAVQSSHQVFPSGIKSSPNGLPSIPEAEWTTDQQALARYAKKVCEFLLDGKAVEVRLHRLKHESHAGWWRKGVGASVLTLNLPSLRWKDQAAVDALLIHECSHDQVDEHLVHAFHIETCRLGAKLAPGYAGLSKYWKLDKPGVAIA